MQFLHGSDVKVHGRLSSSACVVDGRFLLKLRCYGPKCFYEVEEKKKSKKEVLNYNSKDTTVLQLHAHMQTNLFKSYVPFQGKQFINITKVYMNIVSESKVLFIAVQFCYSTYALSYPCLERNTDNKILKKIHCTSNFLYRK